MKGKGTGKAIALLALPALLLTPTLTYAQVGPTSPAYIGDGKTPAEFAQADAYCRDLARSRTGTTPDEASTKSTVGSAVVGGLLGAGLGAGIGAAAGSPGKGAAIGAGAGLLGGAAYGASSGSTAAAAVQQRYDAEYYQCMHLSGHKVPGAMSSPQQPSYYSPQPPPPPAPSGAPQYAPPAAPPSVSAPAPPPPVPAACRPSGKYVRTPEGFKEICE